MVRILANGEIVQDDDPRVRRPNQQRQQGARRQGYIQHEEQPNVGPGGQHVQQVSMFDAINQKLLALGIPRFQLAGTTVEPIATVGVAVVFLLMGVRGLLFIGLLFGVSYLSRQQ
ncbi:protein FAM241B-like [Branchiostoma lanceolatum]|uniref:protein FAM241B-like n=1 Tax=Branchiostoma lanceolatum TaxID=7740 RepID=UPI0034539127